MHNRISSPTPGYTLRLIAWLEDDKRTTLAAWLREPRLMVAYKVSDLGAAISRLAVRIHREVPGDFGDGVRDGQQIAGVYAATTTARTRKDARKLLRGLGVDEEIIASFGFGEDDAARERARAALKALGLPHDDDTLDRPDWIEVSKQRAQEAFEQRHSDD